MSELVTSHAYAANGDRLSTIDPQNHTTTFGYDYYGNRRRVTNALNLTTLTSWNLASTTEAPVNDAPGSGNDVDQASLLISLFRASVLPSGYVHGGHRALGRASGRDSISLVEGCQLRCTCSASVLAVMSDMLFALTSHFSTRIMQIMTFGLRSKRGEVRRVESPEADDRHDHCSRDRIS